VLAESWWSQGPESCQAGLSYALRNFTLMDTSSACDSLPAATGQQLGGPL